jgi:hypothetical protein
VPTFADRGCHMVSITNPYSLNLGFLDWDDGDGSNNNDNNNNNNNNNNNVYPNSDYHMGNATLQK